MKVKNDILKKIDNLKDWLYIQDGAYQSKNEWRADLILAINSVRDNVKSLIKEK